MNFWVGVLVGIVISAVGIGGVVGILDRAVETVKTQVTRLTQ
jgi:hypothetical protein